MDSRAQKAKAQKAPSGRQHRLKAALKANLRRRKTQAKARKTAADAGTE